MKAARHSKDPTDNPLLSNGVHSRVIQHTVSRHAVRHCGNSMAASTLLDQHSTTLKQPSQEPPPSSGSLDQA